MAATASATLQSLSLALRVLDTLRASGEPRGVSDLARAVGSNKATVHRVLVTFEAHGYVEQDAATAKYTTGPKSRPPRLGDCPPPADLPSLARPFLAELRDRTEENAHLAVLDGGDVIYVAKAEGHHPVQVASSVGSRCPAHCVSTGKALLAWSEPGTVDRLVDAGLARHTPLTHADGASFRQEMARVRARGYAVNLGEWRLQVRGVAAPVFDGLGRPVAAIGVCSPAERLADEQVARVAEVVTAVAGRLSRHVAVTGGAALPPVPEPGS